MTQETAIHGHGAPGAIDKWNQFMFEKMRDGGTPELASRGANRRHDPPIINRMRNPDEGNIFALPGLSAIWKSGSPNGVTAKCARTDHPRLTL